VDLSQFEYVIAIAEEGSVSKAAERLFISQSALSQYLLKLEKSLGVKLFKRINRKLILNYAGECYIKAAKDILIIRKNLLKSLDDVSDSKKGRFSMGVTPGRGIDLFSSTYPKFYEKYPDVEINVLEIRSSKSLEQMLLQGRIDIATVSTKTFENDLKYEFISRDEIVFIIRKDHKYAHLSYAASGKRLSIKDLMIFNDEKFVSVSKNSTLRSRIDSLLQEACLTPKIIFEMPTLPMVGRLVEAGLGVGFSFHPYTKDLKDVVEIYLEPQFTRCLWAAYHKDSYLSVSELYYINLLKEYNAINNPESTQ